MDTRDPTIWRGASLGPLVQALRPIFPAARPENMASERNWHILHAVVVDGLTYAAAAHAYGEGITQARAHQIVAREGRKLLASLVE